jgi:hypothetical protein
MDQMATCTHCGMPITKAAKNWLHVDPEPGLNAGFCRPIQVATPTRGSIVRAASHRN